MTQSTNTKNPSPFFIKRILLFLSIFLVFSFGFVPIVVLGVIVYYFLTIPLLWYLLLLPFLLIATIIIVLASQILISGVIIKICKLWYKPGTYEYTFQNKTAFRWILFCALYTPCRKLLEIFPITSLRQVYYELLGMKIGKNCLLGGVIKDPCVTIFGHHVTMGEYAIIYGHIHNYEKGTITIKEVHIGNNCIIGAGAIIMPGAILQDSVTVAAGAVVTGNQILQQGKNYGGVPSQELK